MIPPPRLPAPRPARQSRFSGRRHWPRKGRVPASTERGWCTPSSASHHWQFRNHRSAEHDLRDPRVGLQLVGKGCFDPDSLAECSSRPARTPFRAVDPQMVSSSLRVFRSLMFDGSRPKVQFGHPLGLQPLNQNPVSHPSSIGTVKCDVYQAEATGVESAPSEPARCTIADPNPGFPVLSVTPSTLAIAT